MRGRKIDPMVGGEGIRKPAAVTIRGKEGREQSDCVGGILDEEGGKGKADEGSRG